jgi:hypothetical protein
VKQNGHCAILIAYDEESLWFTVCTSKQKYYVCLTYWPPGMHFYLKNSFIGRLQNDIERFINEENGVIVLCGDFNDLDLDELYNSFALCQLVNCPTRGENILDLFITNQLNLFKVTVSEALVKSDHRAVYVNTNMHYKEIKTPKISRKIEFPDLSFGNVNKLIEAISVEQWATVYACCDVDDALVLFNSICLNYIQCYIPIKQISMTNRDPPFFTPLIKSLLRKRNKAAKQNNHEKVEAINTKVNNLIANNRENAAKSFDCSNIKKMLAYVNHSRSKVPAEIQLTPNDLNDFFVSVATDNDYALPTITNSHISTYCNDTVNVFDVYFQLKQLRRTSTGNDNLPYWFLKETKEFIAEPLTAIINLSFFTGVYPMAWKVTIITPVPKIKKPKVASDFRPISVTPILARITEKIFINKILRTEFTLE